MARLARAAAAAALLAVASARIHSLRIEDDPRFVFSVESFGFAQGGRVDLEISRVDASPEDVPHSMGFVL
jgi:hypothetical protein